MLTEDDMKKSLSYWDIVRICTFHPNPLSSSSSRRSGVDRWTVTSSCDGNWLSAVMSSCDGNWSLPLTIWRSVRIFHAIGKTSTKQFWQQTQLYKRFHFKQCIFSKFLITFDSLCKVGTIFPPNDKITKINLLAKLHLQLHLKKLPDLFKKKSSFFQTNVFSLENDLSRHEKETLYLHYSIATAWAKNNPIRWSANKGILNVQNRTSPDFCNSKKGCVIFMLLL